MKAFLWALIAQAQFRRALAEDYTEPEDFDPIHELALRKINIRNHPGIQTLRAKNYTELGQSCSEAINILTSLYPTQLLLPSTSPYIQWESRFWSIFQSEAQPVAIFQPKSTSEVSVAVLVFRATRCRFQVKSGGHASFRGASSSDGGVTVDLAEIDGITLSDENRVARVGPGNTWGRTYRTLEKSGLAVVGGRVFDIGVGGLTLGGGISFFSSQFGWACDNVVAYEVVTATGKILNVSQNSYPDLFQALRGGGSNFGIVTRFDLDTFEQGKVFVGHLVYDHATQIVPVTDAFFSLGHDVDPKAATWFGLGLSNSTVTPRTLSILVFYATPNPPANVFTQYNRIPLLSNNTKVQGLADATSSPDLNGPIQLRQQTFTHTFRFDKAFIEWYTDFYFKQLDAVTGKWEGFNPYSLFQIITRDSLMKGQRRGGNSIPLREEEAPYLNILLWYNWKNSADDDAVIQFMVKIMAAAKKEAKRRDVFVEYIYLNYAAQYQDVLKSYGEDRYERLKNVARKYDRTGVFQELMPGYFRFGGPPQQSMDQ